MNKKYQCSECGKLLPQEDFWTHKADDRVWKDHSKREYKYSKCKKCCYKNIDWDDKNTILDFCRQFDVPYLEEELQKYIDRYGHQQSLSRYLALMRLRGYYGFGFEDTALMEEWRQQRISYERNRKWINIK